MIVALSGAASATFDGSAVAEADALAGTAAPAASTAAVGGADVVGAAAGAAVFGSTADAAGVGAGAFAAGGLALGGAAATEPRDGDAGFAAGVAVGTAGAADGTASARTLVTIARAATGVFSGSLGRSMRERTTPAPAVAPIAVATKTTRAVRAKLGAGAK